jgi:hypothetical protein
MKLEKKEKTELRIKIEHVKLNDREQHGSQKVKINCLKQQSTQTYSSSEISIQSEYDKPSST